MFYFTVDDFITQLRISHHSGISENEKAQPLSCAFQVIQYPFLLLPHSLLTCSQCAKQKYPFSLCARKCLYLSSISYAFSVCWCLVGLLNTLPGLSDRRYWLVQR